MEGNISPVYFLQQNSLYFECKYVVIFKVLAEMRCVYLFSLYHPAQLPLVCCIPTLKHMGIQISSPMPPFICEFQFGEV
jgi:hypothetical protein